MRPDGRGELRIERAIELVGPDFDAGQPVVIADAELLESPRPEQGFGAFDPVQSGFGDLETGRDSRGETGHRGFLRDREVVRSGDLADFGLRDPVFEKRRVGVQFLDGLQAGAVSLARVGGVRPITDRPDPESPGRFEHLPESHRPAVITALVVVLDEGVAVEFGKRNDLVLDSDLACDPFCVLEFGGRQRLAFRGTGDGPIPEGVGRERGND